MAKVKRYMGDFETTTEETFLKEGRTRVWGVSVRDIGTNEQRVLGNSMNDFIGFCERQTHDQINKEIYFQNLKFDGTFIIDALFRRGYKVIRDDEAPRDKTFSTIISKMGVWYSITIYHKVYGQWGHRNAFKTIIRDSLKKLPFSVKEIAKGFKLGIEKLTIDYDSFRAYDHQLTEEEEEYIGVDTSIISQALKIQFDAGLTAMTIGGDALGYFKAILGKKYDYYFPILDKDTDDDIRKSYKGGYVFCLRPNTEFKEVISFDVNSLYPYTMHSSSGNILPYGIPKFYQGKYSKDKNYPLYIQAIQVNFKLKPNHLPTIQIKHNYKFIETEYLTDSDDELVDLTLTNVDLELLFTHYKIIDIKYIMGYKFRGITGLFDDYIDKWIAEKINNEGAKKLIAKLMLNNLYGKYGTNPERKNIIPRFNKAIGEVEYSETYESVGDPSYTAMASFITAYARYKTISEGQNNYGRLIYMDTDSLHLIGTEHPKGMDIDKNRLGAWKDEGISLRSYFIRAKSYVKLYPCATQKEIDDELIGLDGQPAKLGEPYYKVTCAGMPEKVKKQVTVDNFRPGKKYEGKLTAKKVKGGTILIERDFTIKS